MYRSEELHGGGGGGGVIGLGMNYGYHMSKAGAHS